MITHPYSPKPLSLVAAAMESAEALQHEHVQFGFTWEVSGDLIARARRFMAASDEAFKHANDGPMEVPC